MVTGRPLTTMRIRVGSARKPGGGLEASLDGRPHLLRESGDELGASPADDMHPFGTCGDGVWVSPSDDPHFAWRTRGWTQGVSSARRIAIIARPVVAYT